MKIFHPSDFPTAGSMISYILALRVPIPPVISATEILNYMIAGNTKFVTVVLYRIALVLSFVIAIRMSSSRNWSMAWSIILSVVFLWATTIVHRGNSQVYDIFFPCLILLYVLLLKSAISSARSKWIYIFSAASGFFLSIAELTRPFVFLFLPVVLFCTWCAFRKLPRRYFLCFLAPVVLLSGSWHLHQAVRHRQIIWSNHSGYNLSRAWPMAKRPWLQPEPYSAPLKTGRWDNLNTAEHHENSKLLTKKVVSYFVKNPRDSGGRMISRMRSFLFDVRTDIYDHRPTHGMFMLYRPLVRLSSIWLLAEVCLLVVMLVRVNGRRLNLLGMPGNILIIIAFMSICILAIGESDWEQARLLLSLLPFFAVIPRFGSPG